MGFGPDGCREDRVTRGPLPARTLLLPWPGFQFPIGSISDKGALAKINVIADGQGQLFEHGTKRVIGNTKTRLPPFINVESGPIGLPPIAGATQIQRWSWFP